MKFKLTIAYDGTAYQGWQVQKTGTGVQELIEAAFAKMFPSVKRIHSSSRTDTGVHALGMVAHVEIPRAEFKMPVGRLAIALNAVSLYYYLIVLKHVFVAKPAHEKRHKAVASAPMIGAIALIILLLGIFPAALLVPISDAVTAYTKEITKSMQAR